MEQAKRMHMVRYAGKNPAWGEGFLWNVCKIDKYSLNYDDEVEPNWIFPDLLPNEDIGENTVLGNELLDLLKERSAKS